jgi:hypothetical protein
MLLSRKLVEYPRNCSGSSARRAASIAGCHASGVGRALHVLRRGERDASQAPLLDLHSTIQLLQD